jgi:hypothetical protein
MVLGSGIRVGPLGLGLDLDLDLDLDPFVDVRRKHRSKHDTHAA